MLNESRMKRVLEKMEMDQLLVTDPIAVFYLLEKWFEPGERFMGMVLRRDKDPVLILNELFRTDEDLGIHIVYYRDTDDVALVTGRYTDHTKVLGVDKILPAKFLLPMIQRGIASGFINGSGAVDYTRAVKDKAEIELMKESSRINDAAMAEFRKLVHAGVREIDIADQMLDIYKKLGAEGYSFEPIVAFGRNAADPHHMPDETVLKEGDAVLFDVGCKYHNYCSDMTRTFFYKKEPSAKQKAVYDLVRSANECAEAIVRPDIRLCDIDKTARDIITDGGFGKDFTHRLGHFIGIQDHEYGDVSASFEDMTQPGNIFSIEPGIYNPDILGCRIEDLILVTEDGHEVLNHYSHEIEVIE